LFLLKKKAFDGFFLEWSERSSRVLGQRISSAGWSRSELVGESVHEWVR